MHSSTQPQPSSQTSALTLGALGIVYGDLGTSPLYTMRTCFSAFDGLSPTVDNVLGVLSLIFWTLSVVVTLKYVAFLMKADNQGEGGIIALMALALGGVKSGTIEYRIIVYVGLIGGALFFGDGMITPAISVLSAVEGLEIATPLFTPYVMPITIVVLIALFVFQRYGTTKVGSLFGPVMLVWFLCLGLLGLLEIIQQPQVLRALNPAYGLAFFSTHGLTGFLVLGGVVLAVTGAEALYTDMGHFGAKPIQLAWLYFVFPCLVLNYYGQGALLIIDPGTLKNPFFLLAPDWALYPMVVLATLATIIASQAVITGAFSVTRQVIQLGFCPRMEIIQTSHDAFGQIYIPRANWGLLAAILCVVLFFRTSENLASAYGIAVTGTMLGTTTLAAFVVRSQWGWSMAKTVILVGSLWLIDAALFGANCLKIFDGGWFPITIGVITFTLQTTWKRGRELLFNRLRDDSISLESFLGRVSNNHPIRVPGIAVFMTGVTDHVPFALLHNWKHNKVLHETNVLLTVKTMTKPLVLESERFEAHVLNDGFYKMILRYGFMEDPDVPETMNRLHEAGKFQTLGLKFNIMEASFFLGRERLVPSVRPGMALWREFLFFTMSRNASSACDFFTIPSNRVVELGTQVEL
ncbi:putative potassium transport system protein Kup [uncultured Gammaproteobacteria bacterium]